MKERKISNPFALFSDGQEVVKFANEFLLHRKCHFDKDIDICLTAKVVPWCRPGENHAYMPALMAIISFWEFMSGFYKGSLSHKKRKTKMIKYAKDCFLEYAKYDPEELNLIVTQYRDKIAHLSHPIVPDVWRTKDGNRHVTFDITEEMFDPAVRAEMLPVGRKFQKTKPVPPWTWRYDTILKVSLPQLHKDVSESALVYLAKLREDVDVQRRFCEAMTDYYTPWSE